jgi:hypothetical protein
MSDDKPQQSEGQVSDAESMADAGEEIFPDQATAGYPIHPEDGDGDGSDDVEAGGHGVEGSKPQEGTAGPNASPYSGKPE